MPFRRIGSLLIVLAVLSGCASSADESAIETSLGNEALSVLNLKQALLHFDEAIRLDPENAEAHLKRGQIRWQGNQFEAAIPDLDRAIELDSSLTWAYYFRGVSLVTLGRLEAGVNDLGTVIRRDELETTDQVRAYTWRSIALFKLERFDESIEDLTMKVTLEPEQVIHRIDRGGAYHATGATEEAIADYRAALAMDPIADDLIQMVNARLDALGVSEMDRLSPDSTTGSSVND